MQQLVIAASHVLPGCNGCQVAVNESTHSTLPCTLPLQSFGRRLPFVLLDDVRGRFFAAYGSTCREVRGPAGWLALYPAGK